MNLRRSIIQTCFVAAAAVFGTGCASTTGLASSRDRVEVGDACAKPAADHGDQTPKASNSTGPTLKLNIFKKKANHPSNYPR